MLYLLNKRENGAVRYVKKLYRKRYKREASDDKDLVVFLGDNPRKFLCWSASSNRVPTLRMNTGKMFIVSKNRWLLVQRIELKQPAFSPVSLSEILKAGTSKIT